VRLLETGLGLWMAGLKAKLTEGLLKARLTEGLLKARLTERLLKARLTERLLKAKLTAGLTAGLLRVRRRWLRTRLLNLMLPRQVLAGRLERLD